MMTDPDVRDGKDYDPYMEGGVFTLVNVAATVLNIPLPTRVEDFRSIVFSRQQI